jgi:hypothetical protein
MPAKMPRLLDRVERVRLLASLLDQAWQVPGTNFRLGLDSLIGLIPGVGDAASALLSGYIIYEAAQAGVPKATLARMAWHVGVDTFVGAVPLAGDLFDMAYKSNVRNLRLLEQHLAQGDVVVDRSAVRPMSPAASTPIGFRRRAAT